MKEASQKFNSELLKEKSWHTFQEHLFYLSSDFNSARRYSLLKNRIIEITPLTKEKTKEVIYYLAVPPQTVPVIIERLAQHSLCGQDFSTRIIMEKPFGTDFVQNHLMQLLALVAMEPPVGFAADLIRNEKVKIFQTIRPMDNDYIDTYTVRGQYGPGGIKGKNVCSYREEENVPPDSNTPTFFAGKFFIDNWRWAGVPFYIRTGKRLAKRITQIVVQFKQPPLRLFGRTCDILEPNHLVLNIQPEEEIFLRFSVKYPEGVNRLYPVTMNFNYQKSFNLIRHPAYERVLIECMKGDLTLFARQDGIEAMWSVVDLIINRWETIPALHFPNYPSGGWGPKEASLLLERDGRKWKT